MEKKLTEKKKLRSRVSSAVDHVVCDDVNNKRGSKKLPYADSVSELLEFYASIPDYGEVHHLSDTEFNLRLKALREKRRAYLQYFTQNYDKINENKLNKNNCDNLKKAGPSYSDIGLMGKRCEFFDKSCNVFTGYPHESKIHSRNSFYDINCRDQLVFTPESLSVASSDVPDQSKYCNVKNKEKSTLKINNTYATSRRGIRLGSGSSAAVSEKLTAELLGKFECVSDSDSGSVLSHSQFNCSKTLKPYSNKNKNSNTSLCPSSRKKKFWSPDSNKYKLNNEVRYANTRISGRTNICHSVPDLRVSPPTFHSITESKNNCSPSENTDDLQRSFEEKNETSNTVPSPAAQPSENEQNSTPISKHLEGTESNELQETICLPSGKKGKYCRMLSMKPRSKNGIYSKRGTTSMGCSSCCGIASISTPESFTSTIRLRSYPQSAIIPSKNNLAAILRIQSTRRKMENDLEKKLTELKRKEDACIKAHLARQQPAWQAIQYTAEEDIAIRRIIRKEKELKHLREHQQQMILMLARVQQIPPLFERQTSTRLSSTAEKSQYRRR